MADQPTEPTTEIARPTKRAKFADLVTAMSPRLAEVLPTHLTPERMAAIVRAEGGRNPQLMDCDPSTVALCVMASAELGLEPAGPMGHAYLIPRANRKTGRTECTLIIGYKGLCELARRSGTIREMYAHTVHERDEWSYSLGLSRDLAHRPATGDRGEVVAAYAVVRTHDGGVFFEVLERTDIDARRPKNAKYGPWSDHYAAMARKTALRALLSGGTVPMSAEVAAQVARAIEIDREADGPHEAEVIEPTGDAMSMLGLSD